MPAAPATAREGSGHGVEERRGGGVGKGSLTTVGQVWSGGGKGQSREAGKRRAQSFLGFLSSMPTISPHHNH